MSQSQSQSFYRREYSKLVASLSCRFSVKHLQTIEDAVQAALVTALESRADGFKPDKPSAWLYRVAHNKVLEELRQDGGRKRILQAHAPAASDAALAPPVVAFEYELTDDLLRMLFYCCDPSIPPDSQLALALKVLCGFDVRNIALRLFTSEANIYKRLARARTRLREIDFTTAGLDSEDFCARLPGVHKVLYLLFTEGHLSAQTHALIRSELCHEAIRLCTLLAERALGHVQATYALLALMHLQTARTPARKDAAGGLLLLEEQDRQQWDRNHIAQGMQWLARSADGDRLTRYHAEAGIAAEHCLAPSFAETRWHRVVECYEPTRTHRSVRAQPTQSRHCTGRMARPTDCTRKPQGPGTTVVAARLLSLVGRAR